MIRFYDHRKTGVLHFRATSGGGENTTSTFDAPATREQIDKHPVEYGDYLRMKANGSDENRKNKSDLELKDIYISDLEAQLDRAKLEIERLNALLARR